LCLLFVKTLTSCRHVWLWLYMVDLPFIFQLEISQSKKVHVLSLNQTGKNWLNCSTHWKEISKRCMEELLWLQYMISQFLDLKKGSLGNKDAITFLCYMLHRYNSIFIYHKNKDFKPSLNFEHQFENTAKQWSLGRYVWKIKLITSELVVSMLWWIGQVPRLAWDY